MPLVRQSISALLLSIAALSSLAQPTPGTDHALRLLDGDNAMSAHFAISESADNTIGFFYASDLHQLMAASCAGVPCWGSVALSNPATDRGRYVSAVARPALFNRPIAAYYDATNGDLMLFDCAFTDCAGGTERLLDSAGDVGQDTAIAIDPATGFAVIAYYDAGNADLKLYRCANAACDNGSPVLVDGSGDRGHGASIAFAGSTLWIAYEDRSSGEIRLARSSAPFATFTYSTHGAGAEPSLSATAGGLLDMVWRETTGHTLQRLQCLNADCTSANQHTLAGAGRGYRPSASRQADGQLMVSHYEPNGQVLRGTLCADAACTTPQALVFASGAAVSGASAARIAGTLPTVFFHDGQRADVRAAQCSAADCANIAQRPAFNGIAAGNARLALRADGRAVVAYIRERRPWLALCADALCTSHARVPLSGANSDARPALAIRADGRPLAYFSSVGGSELYDCANTDCSAGTPRTISAPGSSTATVMEMALRSDGRPLLLYYNNSLRDVFVYDCANAGCSSGTARMVADEPNTAFVQGFRIEIGAGDRAVIMYTVVNAGSTQVRYLRCTDSACSGANTVANVGSANTFTNIGLAIRSDGRPAFVDFGNGSQFVLCDTVDCTGQSRFPIGISGLPRTLVMTAGDRPALDQGTNGAGRVLRCADATCTSSQISTVILDAHPQSSYQGSIALAPNGDIIAAFDESSLGDVMIAIPLIDLIFRDGVE
jgi:hypothetical protein